MQYVPDQLSPLAEFSKAESEGFSNPVLPYDPAVDMNELYAKYDPTTWGDALEKTWDTATNNLWSGTLNLWNGLKEGITDGRVSALWDNQYSKELAEVTENLEKMKPMRFSADEQDDYSTWFKQVFPSIGYVGASVVEMAAQHIVLAASGAVIGAVAGEGVGAIPGAFAGTMAAFAKDAQTIGNAMTNISRTARAINTLSTANKIKKGAQLLGYGLLSANGEAALNSQFAAHAALEEQKKRYYDETGQYLSGQGLLDAEEAANKTGSVTFALNLPLIAATNLFEFGNVMRGKAIPQISEKLAFSVSKETGKAVMKGYQPYLKVIGGYLKESGAEGFEELAQGVIEDSSVKYFTQRAENRKNYLTTFADAAYNRATSKEGMSDFAAGAFIGGMSNAADLMSVGKVKANTKQFVDKYNSATNHYFHALGNAVTTDNNLKDALKNGDSERAKQIYQEYVVGLVNNHAKAGTTQSFTETLDALSDMDNAEFRKHFNVALNQDEQNALIQGVTQEYKIAAKQRQIVDTAFQINPFEAESWFQKQINKRKEGFNLGDKQAAAQEVWDVFKDTLTDNLVRHGSVGQERKLVEREGLDLSPEFISLTGRDIPSLVAAQKASLRQKVAANLPGYGAEEALLAQLDSTEDTTEQYKILLADADKRTPGLRDVVKKHNVQLQMEEILFDKLQNLNTKAGQRKAIKKILDWQKYYEDRVAEQGAVQTPPTTVSTEVVVPENTDPTEAPVEAPTEVPAQDVVEPLILPPIPAVTPVADTTLTTEEEDLADLYGEGKGEEYVAPVKPTKETKAPEAPKKKLPDPIDPEAPEDIQVDNTTVQRAVDGLNEGEEIVPADSGVKVSKDGEEISKLKLEKGKVKGEKKDGSVVDIKENEVPLLQVDKAPVENNPIADIVTREGLSPEKELLLTNLNKGGYIEFVCT